MPRWADDAECFSQAGSFLELLDGLLPAHLQAFDVDRFLRNFWGCSLTLKTPVEPSVCCHLALLSQLLADVDCQVGWIRVPYDVHKDTAKSFFLLRVHVSNLLLQETSASSTVKIRPLAPSLAESSHIWQCRFMSVRCV